MIPKHILDKIKKRRQEDAMKPKQLSPVEKLINSVINSETLQLNIITRILLMAIGTSMFMNGIKDFLPHGDIISTVAGLFTIWIGLTWGKKNERLNKPS